MVKIFRAKKVLKKGGPKNDPFFDRPLFGPPFFSPFSALTTLTLLCTFSQKHTATATGIHGTSYSSPDRSEPLKTGQKRVIFGTPKTRKVHFLTNFGKICMFWMSRRPRGPLPRPPFFTPFSTLTVLPLYPRSNIPPPEKGVKKWSKKGPFLAIFDPFWTPFLTPFLALFTLLLIFINHAPVNLTQLNAP